MKSQSYDDYPWIHYYTGYRLKSVCIKEKYSIVLFFRIGFSVVLIFFFGDYYHIYRRLYFCLSAIMFLSIGDYVFVYRRLCFCLSAIISLDLSIYIISFYKSKILYLYIEYIDYDY